MVGLNSHDILRCNELDEARFFDRVAEVSLNEESFIPSGYTFSRYRCATFGKPIYRMYPDRMFCHIGNIFKDTITHYDSRIPLKGLDVLDLGAGDGIWSMILAEQGANVTSIEISPKQVGIAKKRMLVSGISWDARVGSAYDLEKEFGRQRFDFVFGMGILHHLTFGLDRVSAGIKSILRNGGYSLFLEPFSGSPILRSIRKSLDSIVPLDQESPDERPLETEDIALIRKVFPRVDLEFFDIFAKFARRPFSIPLIERAMHRVDHLLQHQRIFHKIAGQVFIAARS
jgi:2-polyprenyl-3-methyl-5-hydroxy-6-metoxy-1,4-benzoquinol methylase